VIMMKGWARFMYDDKPTLVSAGDVVHQKPGLVHYLYDYSPTWNISRSSAPRTQDRRYAAGDRQGPARDTLEVTPMSSPEELPLSSAVGCDR